MFFLSWLDRTVFLWGAIRRHILNTLLAKKGPNGTTLAQFRSIRDQHHHNLHHNGSFQGPEPTTTSSYQYHNHNTNITSSSSHQSTQCNHPHSPRAPHHPKPHTHPIHNIHIWALYTWDTFCYGLHFWWCFCAFHQRTFKICLPSIKARLAPKAFN